MANIYKRISELSGLAEDAVEEKLKSLRGNSEAIESNAELIGHIRQAYKEVAPTQLARAQFDGARLGQDANSPFVVNRVINGVEGIYQAQQNAGQKMEQAAPTQPEKPITPQMDEVEVFNNVDSAVPATIMNRISDLSGMSVDDVTKTINSIQSGADSVENNAALNEAMKQALTEISPTMVARYESQAARMGQAKDSAFVMNRIMRDVESIHEGQKNAPQEQKVETPDQPAADNLTAEASEPAQSEFTVPENEQADFEAFKARKAAESNVTPESQEQQQPITPQEDAVEVYNEQSEPAGDAFTVPEDELEEFEAFKQQHMAEFEAFKSQFSMSNREGNQQDRPEAQSPQVALKGLDI